jgi:hypothetical protein
MSTRRWLCSARWPPVAARATQTHIELSELQVKLSQDRCCQCVGCDLQWCQQQNRTRSVMPAGGTIAGHNTYARWSLLYSLQWCARYIVQTAGLQQPGLLHKAVRVRSSLSLYHARLPRPHYLCGTPGCRSLLFVRHSEECRT